LAALIVKVPGLPDVVAERELSESDRYQLRMRLLLTVRNAVEAEGCTSMSSIAGDDVEGIVGVPQHRDRPQALRAIAKQVSQVVSRDFEGMKTVIGAASAATPENLLNAFDNAALSAQYGTRISASEAFYYHDEVGLDYLLLHLADGPYLARFVEAYPARPRCCDPAAAASHSARLSGEWHAEGRHCPSPVRGQAHALLPAGPNRSST
jgi:hypothetical protein